VTRVAIVGASGRMGRAMTGGLDELDSVTVVALVARSSIADERWRADLSGVSEQAIDAVVDFSTPSVSAATLDWCLDHHVLDVIGTSGLPAGELERWSHRVDQAQGCAIYAANFSLGAVLIQRFAAEAAPYFPRCEIIEMHHDAKRDAPSGTSLATSSAVAAARRSAGLPPAVDPTELETLPHARGAEGEEGVRIHSVRLAGLVAHQEVLFGGPGEGLTLRHDSYDRVSFVAGVALALERGRGRQGLTVGLEGLLSA
jgi:4-hydroxy-tetrahydrodipicolinate reductase